MPAQSQSVARYVAKYVVSPPIAVRRIDRYDGRRVTYHYRSHRTDRMEYETVPVDTFIGRMVQHVMPKGQPFQYGHLCAISLAVETCCPF